MASKGKQGNTKHACGVSKTINHSFMVSCSRVTRQTLYSYKWFPVSYMWNTKTRDNVFFVLFKVSKLLQWRFFLPQAPWCLFPAVFPGNVGSPWINSVVFFIYEKCYDIISFDLVLLYDKTDMTVRDKRKCFKVRSWSWKHSWGSLVERKNNFVRQSLSNLRSVEGLCASTYVFFF